MLYVTSCFLAPLDVFCVDETKLGDRFPNSQFLIKNFQLTASVGIETQIGMDIRLT